MLYIFKTFKKVNIKSKLFEPYHKQVLFSFNILNRIFQITFLI